jgi:hypothetical protein
VESTNNQPDAGRNRPAPTSALQFLSPLFHLLGTLLGRALGPQLRRVLRDRDSGAIAPWVRAVNDARRGRHWNLLTKAVVLAASMRRRRALNRTTEKAPS